MDQQLIISVKGIVQGVGFRPKMFNYAKKFNLKGKIQNTGSSVFMTLEGEKNDLKHFLNSFKNHVPPETLIEEVNHFWRPSINFKLLEIVESNLLSSKNVSIPVDLATCKDCFNDIYNSKNLRYNYPFTTCSSCGPRYSVVKEMPYDRERTTLNKFPLCSICLKEYSTPHNRRFHAESMACPKCGPQIEIWNNQQEKLSYTSNEKIFEKARTFLKEGKILALRGLGGYLLVCDATNTLSIELLRKRKKRPTKSFAVMARNKDQLQSVVKTKKEDLNLFQSSISPIIVLPPNSPSLLPINHLSPDTETLGMMLPTSPLHSLLFDEELNFLIMTSGNSSSEPIAKTNSEAFERLSTIADYFITHNREIERVCDDSVYLSAGKTPKITRMGRGVSPKKIPVKKSFSNKILALGADLKNSFSFGYDQQIITSPYNGNLSNSRTYEHFLKQIASLKNFYQFNPDIVAVDKHPNYLSSEWGRKISQTQGIKLLKVQHHHAHAVSCMVENQVEDTLALVFDGTGFGEDGTLWGGELLYVNKREFKRLGSLTLSSLPGSRSAILNPNRQALTRLIEAKVPITPNHLKKLNLSVNEFLILEKMIRKKVNTPLTSSIGRLFDSASGILGLNHQEISYEGEAAIRLEKFAKKSGLKYISTKKLNLLSYKVIKDQDDLYRFDPLSFIPEMYDRSSKESIEDLAYIFHLSLTTLALHMARIGRQLLGRQNCCLTGGVFQNQLFSNTLEKALREDGFNVFTHKTIPSNDQGISIGQTEIANNLLQ